MKKEILSVVLLTFLIQFVFAGENSSMPNKSHGINVIPGKSLGEVSIGDQRSDLVAKGFSPRKHTDPSDFLQKDSVVVRLVDKRVVQIWYNGKTEGLQLRGEKFPLQNDSKTLTKFFKGCEPTIRGSGGILIYCEERGIELAYSFSGELQGISIVTPSVVEQIIGPKK